MSEREQAALLMGSVPEYKIGYVLSFLQGLIADEQADDAFCEKLLEDYNADPNKGNFVSFEDACKELGVTL